MARSRRPGVAVIARQDSAVGREGEQREVDRAEAVQQDVSAVVEARRDVVRHGGHHRSQRAMERWIEVERYAERRR